MEHPWSWGGCWGSLGGQGRAAQGPGGCLEGLGKEGASWEGVQVGSLPQPKPAFQELLD